MNYFKSDGGHDYERVWVSSDPDRWGGGYFGGQQLPDYEPFAGLRESELPHVDTGPRALL